MGAAKMLEANFSDKKEAEEKIHQTVEKYLKTFDDRESGFDARFELFSNNYKAKLKKILNHAIHSEKKVVDKLMAAEQMQIFSFRESFNAQQLDSLSLKDILKIQNDQGISFMSSDAEFQNLLFYNANQATGSIKSLFSVSPVLFDREGNDWKIDLAGDPLHQKMKEQKLASLQKKSYSEYKKTIQEALDVKEESWVPLSKR